MNAVFFNPNKARDTLKDIIVMINVSLILVAENSIMMLKGIVHNKITTKN